MDEKMKNPRGSVLIIISQYYIISQFLNDIQIILIINTSK
jgi:hypothetical protein